MANDFLGSIPGSAGGSPAKRAGETSSAGKLPALPEQHEIGMVGLGVMGCNLLLNMADHGFSVAGYDHTPEKVENLRKQAQQHSIYASADLADFVASLRRPRAIMLLVPAGAAVDAVIKDLLPHLQAGDLIIDAGNSFFKDTDIRSHNLAEQGIQFLGVGISGGEEGARLGPSIMPGGPKEAYQRVQAILEAVAAKVDNKPCVAYMGPGSAGHFVKMVHNGIEYGLMQLIAETYDLLKRGLGFSNQQLHDVYSEWNRGELNSYLLEISAAIFSKVDALTGKPLIDEILAVAAQKGTGMWTSQTALDLQVPTPNIDVADIMRDMSKFIKEREQAFVLYPLALATVNTDHDVFLSQLQHAMFAAMLIVYAQGMALLRVASEQYGYHLDLETIASIWRGGCIIRAGMLEDLRAAFRRKDDLVNPLLDPELARQLMERQESLRQVVYQTARLGIPAPGFMTALSYFDSYRSAWLPANLIQAQRDYFGAHTYERIDRKGAFHTEW